MVSVAINLPEEIRAEEAGILLAIKLLELRRISLGKAAEIAGYTKSAFVEILSKYNIPIIDYSADELAHEVEM